MHLRNILLTISSILIGIPLFGQQCAHSVEQFPALRSLTDQLIRSGELEKCESVLRTCRQQWSSQGAAPAHPVMLESGAYLGQILAILGRLPEASTILQDAYRLATSSEDPLVRRTIAVLAASLGAFHRHQGNHARALPLLRVAHQRFVEYYGPKDFSAGLVLLEIGAVQAQDGDIFKAEQSFLEAHRILDTSGYQEEVMTCEMYLAAIQVAQGRMTEAEQLILKARRRLAATAPSTLAAAGLAMGEYYLARIYRLQGRKQEATVQYQKAIEAYEATIVQPYPKLSKVVEEYAGFLRKSKDPEAKMWAARARTLR